jgi:short-subunit dehydrogenase
LITGASGGIGEALAWEFARNGHNLMLVARRKDKLDALALELAKTHNIACDVVAADLSKPEAPDQVVYALQQANITVDMLVNNAGVGIAGRFADIDLQRELDMLQLNVASLVHLTKLLLPRMIARRWGRILMVSSTAGFVPGPLMAGYYASKGYVLSLSVALREELQGTGVTVTTLCPGPTETGFGAAADVNQSRLFRWFSSGDVTGVAHAAFRGLMRGRAIVAPGWFAKLIVGFGGIGPRPLAAKVARFLDEGA